MLTLARNMTSVTSAKELPAHLAKDEKGKEQGPKPMRCQCKPMLPSLLLGVWWRLTWRASSLDLTLTKQPLCTNYKLAEIHDTL